MSQNHKYHGKYIKLLFVLWILTTIGISLLTWAWYSQNTEPFEKLTVRQIVVVDENGTERIIVGSPLPNPKDGIRKDASTGMVINDENGWERFGVGLNEVGAVGMGFDAPPGVGDPRNRERMNLNVYSNGMAEWRILDNTTRVKARFILDEDRNAKLQFVDWSKDEPEVITLGLEKIKELVTPEN